MNRCRLSFLIATSACVLGCSASPLSDQLAQQGAAAFLASYQPTGMGEHTVVGFTMKIVQWNGLVRKTTGEYQGSGDIHVEYDNPWTAPEWDNTAHSYQSVYHHRPVSRDYPAVFTYSKATDGKWMLTGVELAPDVDETLLGLNRKPFFKIDPATLPFVRRQLAPSGLPSRGSEQLSEKAARTAVEEYYLHRQNPNGVATSVAGWGGLKAESETSAHADITLRTTYSDGAARDNEMRVIFHLKPGYGWMFDAWSRGDDEPVAIADPVPIRP